MVDVMNGLPAPVGGRTPAPTGAALLTYCDDLTGERVELPEAALAGWVSRTVALLRGGCGLGPGDRMALLLPPHWQTAAIVLGGWSAGLAISFRPLATAGLAAIGPGAGAPLDAVFVARDRVDSWLEDVPDAPHRFVVGRAPGDGGPTEVPVGYRDYGTEVGRYAASALVDAPVLPNDPASVDGTTFREWGNLARTFAVHLGLRPGDRLLVDASAREHPAMWLLAPLSVGASVVLCANLDKSTIDSRAAAERATRILS
jgi:uncharacterized protein (TIGR03089 family)